MTISDESKSFPIIAHCNTRREHTVPSVEFTFSCGSSSAGRPTPTSSQDGTVGFSFNELDRLSPLSRAQRSNTPGTTTLFQNLTLNDDPEHRSRESSSDLWNGQQDSGLPTYRDKPIYRDPFNSIPVGSSVEQSTRPSVEPVSPSLSKTGSLALGLERLTLKKTANQPGENEDTGGEIGGKDDDEDGYNVLSEELPRAPVYNTRLQSSLRDVRVRLTNIANIMGRSDLVRDHTTDCYDLYKKTLEASQFEYPETRTVGFIGDSGVGKSTVINSLLDQEGLARSSGDGAACTSVVTEFRNVDERHPQRYTVEAEFMSIDEIRELLEELLRTFRRYYTGAFREVDNAEEQERIRASSVRAWETLSSLFRNQPGLNHEFLSSEADNAEVTIRKQLEEWAMSGLRYRPGGHNALHYSTVASDVEECKEALDMLTTDSPEQDKPAIWPFVRLIRVYLKSPILRTGVVLADLPGFRDLNYARILATERYLRHNCDEVFIVSKITRCLTDQSIRETVDRCTRNKPVRIVCTRSEDVDANETARAYPESAGRINQLTGQIDKLRKLLRTITARRRRSSGEESQQLAAKESDLRDEKENLDFELQRFLIIRRNRYVTQSLTRNYDNVKVFCVSNKLYTDHRDGDGPQAADYISLSGITELRCYCQSVPADAQMCATASFLQNSVPALLRSLKQWTLAGSDTVTAENTATLHRVLTEAEQTIQSRLVSRQSQIRPVEARLKMQVDSSIIQSIRHRRDYWTSEAIEASQEWATWYHQTYAAYCRNYGTYSTRAQRNRCWNEELLQPARAELTNQWESILCWLEDQRNDLEEQVNNIFESICGSIEEHIYLSPSSLENLLDNMEARKRCILEAISKSFNELIQKTEDIKSDSTHGHGTSYISSIMRPAYNACIAEYGTGSDARRKKIMHDHVQYSRLFSQLSTKIKTAQLELTSQIFENLQRNVQEEVRNITRDLRASITVEGEATEAGQDQMLAERVKEGVGRLEGCLNDAQGVLGEVRQGND